MRCRPLESPHDLIVRFIERIKVQDNGCWQWVGSKIRGYGYIRVERRMVRAHRFSWEYHNRSTIPSGKVVCHKCDNPSCVNPNHLFVATQSENIQDMVSKGRQTGGAGTDGRFKLTDLQVLEIRRIRSENNLTYKDIGEMFGVNKRTIQSIVNNESRKDVS